MFSKYWWLSSPLLDGQPSPAQRGILGGQRATPLSCFQAQVGQPPAHHKASRCHQSPRTGTNMGASDPAGHLLVPIAPAGSPHLVWGHRMGNSRSQGTLRQAGRGVPVKQRDKVVFRTVSFCRRRACSSFPSCTSCFICKHSAFGRSSLVSVSSQCVHTCCLSGTVQSWLFTPRAKKSPETCSVLLSLCPAVPAQLGALVLPPRSVLAAMHAALLASVGRSLHLLAAGPHRSHRQLPVGTGPETQQKALPESRARPGLAWCFRQAVQEGCCVQPKASQGACWW